MRRLRPRNLQKGGADEFEQVAVAGLVLRQQQQRRRLVLMAPALPGGVPDGEQRADYGLDAGAGGVDGELHRAEEIAAVRDRHRRHAGLPAKRDEVLDPDRPFRERIGGMHPQMHEIGMSHGARAPWSSMSRDLTGFARRKRATYQQTAANRRMDRAPALDTRLAPLLGTRGEGGAGRPAARPPVRSYAAASAASASGARYGRSPCIVTRWPLRSSGQ